MERHWKIALLRPSGRNEEAKQICEEKGFVPFIAPAIEIHSISVDTNRLKQLLMRASVCVLMSSTAGETLLEHLDLPGSLLTREGLVVVSVGEATRHFLGLHSVESITPASFSSEGIATLIISMQDLVGPVLVLRSNKGNSVLRERLARKGIEVVEVALYGIVMPEDLSPLKRLISELVNGKRFVIPFSSSMMVRNFFTAAGEVAEHGKVMQALEGCSVWAIGSETEREIRRQGLKNCSVAHTADYNSMLGEIFESMRGAVE